MFSYLKKLNKDCSYELFDINMEKLVKGNFPEAKDDNNQESLNYLEQYFDHVTVDKTVHKAPGSMSLLYEQMI